MSFTSQDTVMNVAPTLVTVKLLGGLVKCSVNRRFVSIIIIIIPTIFCCTNCAEYYLTWPTHHSNIISVITVMYSPTTVRTVFQPFFSSITINIIHPDWTCRMSAMMCIRHTKCSLLCIENYKKVHFLFLYTSNSNEADLIIHKQI